MESRPYLKINSALAHRLKLVMADVDGTLNNGGEEVSPAVSDAINGLQESGITVGLISGRTDPMLVRMASSLGIKGPLISENGAVTRLSREGGMVELGYSRRPALAALEVLKARYPGRIREREDNSERLIDIVFFADGLAPDELKKGLKNVQLLDSTYILHLMQKGIDKGGTLKRLLALMKGGIRPDRVLVVGDSMTDLSLFKLFTNSVLIPNPNISEDDRKKLRRTARYESDHESGQGFAEVALHIINVRSS